MNVEDAVNLLDLPILNVVLYAETKYKDFYIDGDKMKLVFYKREKEMTPDGYVGLTNLIDSVHKLLDAEDCKSVKVNYDDKVEKGMN